MAATLHKLTAGDGYLYLIRQVAASDSTERGRNTLSEYYSAKGESPGRWVGTGLASLSDTGARDVSDTARCRKSGLCQRVPRSTKNRWPRYSGKGCTPTPSTSPTTPWAAEPNRPWPSKPPTWAADSPCAPGKPSSNGHWQWPTASTTPGSARSGIPPSTTTSGRRSEPPWRGSDSPTNTVASPPTTANCRASSPATPAPAPRRSPDTT